MLAQFQSVLYVKDLNTSCRQTHSNVHWLIPHIDFALSFPRSLFNEFKTEERFSTGLEMYEGYSPLFCARNTNRANQLIDNPLYNLISSSGKFLANVV